MPADDRLTGNDGSMAIDTGPAVPLDITDFDYGERNEHVKGRTAQHRGTGRVYTGTDWDANVTTRIEASVVTPNFFRRGATIAFDMRTDAAASPALKIVGAGMCTEARLIGRVENYLDYRLKIECSDQTAAGLPAITPA
jgi:hypothetical protein